MTAPQPPDQPSPRLRSIRALLVEDDADCRAMYEELPSFMGAHVLAVATATEGLTEYLTFKPHVLISDLGVEGDAFALAARAGADGVPAIAVTGRNVQQQALGSGFRAFLMKPVDPFTLGEEVARLALAG